MSCLQIVPNKKFARNENKSSGTFPLLTQEEAQSQVEQVRVANFYSFPKSKDDKKVRSFLFDPERNQSMLFAISLVHRFSRATKNLLKLIFENLIILFFLDKKKL